MGKRAALIPVILIVLGGLLGWRVHMQSARRNAPTGGSTTVEGTETVVASRITGRLAELLVREGDAVAAGQVVGRLECSDPEAQLLAGKARLAAAEAQREVASAAEAQAKKSSQVTQAQVEVTRAQEQVLAVDQERAAKDLGRTTRLHQSGAVSEAIFDTETLRSKNLAEQRALLLANQKTAQASSEASRAAARTASAQVAATAAQLEAARADLVRVQLLVDECRLVAPRAGVVTERLYEPGAVVAAGARVLTIVDLSVVKVVFFVPDAELGRVRPGAPAELRVDAFAGRVWSGVVRRVASEAEFTPRDVQTREDRDRLVYAVEIEVQNPDGALRAGMPGDVVLPGTAPGQGPGPGPESRTGR